MNKNNGIGSVIGVLAPILALFFMLFYIFGDRTPNNREISTSEANRSEFVSKQNKSDSSVSQEVQLINFLKKYKDKYSTLIPLKLSSLNNVFYYNSEGNTTLLFDESLSDLTQNENSFVKVLENNQSEFDKETKNVLNQFKVGDPASRISLLSSKSGKAHLIYKNQSKNLSENLSGLFLDITIYYNPGSEEDKLSESLGILADFAQKSGQVYKLNIVNINQVDPVEQEDIRYSGDIIAVAHPVQISGGTINSYPKLRSRVDLSDNPQNILKLTEYYN
jgi:hypothetical protein